MHGYVSQVYPPAGLSVPWDETSPPWLPTRTRFRPVGPEGRVCALPVGVEIEFAFGIAGVVPNFHNSNHSALHELPELDLDGLADVGSR